MANMLFALVVLLSLGSAYAAQYQANPTGPVHFLETFEKDWASRWVHSKDEKYNGERRGGVRRSESVCRARRAMGGAGIYSGLAPSRLPPRRGAVVTSRPAEP